MKTAGAPFSERVVEFGPGNRLVGVLTSPAGGTGRSPVVLFLNAGIVHRVGPNRLHVRLARFLAARGIPSFRYDLPGIGDSDPLGGGTPDEQAVVSVSAALDRLQMMKVADQSVLVGLCAGADQSLAAALVDPRVVGAFMIDPPMMFSTRRHRIIKFLRRAGRGVRKPSAVWQMLTGRRKFDVLGHITEDEAREFGVPVAPSGDTLAEERGRMADAFNTLARRSVRIFYLVTSHNSEVMTYRTQITDAFPEIPQLRKLLQADVRPQADHTFSREGDRVYLENTLAEWLEKSVFPSAAPAA
ncbi:MAG: alpha/beta fold hydrolase [Gemmatimonadota bacterium]|jgi:pimeloyl-ACP methyl ester carboxylesterase|nr:alpha/beta fold hydrolase [Gemmatimonadota bacterium]